MALWDGLVVDAEAAQTCGELLQEIATEIGTAQAFANDDSRTTITANGNGTDALASLNEVSGEVGGYLNVENSNLSTTVAVMNEVDEELSNAYS